MDARDAPDLAHPNNLADTGWLGRSGFGGNKYLQPVLLLDLRLQGAMVEAPSAIVALGDVIPFTLLTEVDGAPASLDELLLHYLAQTSQTAPP